MVGTGASGGREARSAAMTSARRLFAAHEQSARTGMPVAEVLGSIQAARSHQPDAGWKPGRRTRRELLVSAGGLAGGAVVAGHPAAGLARRRARARARPRFAVVGAGLAGLRCAHMLWTQSPGSPFASTVYEAHPARAGGRCWTLRDFFSGGLITEHGGSFLNSNQAAVRRLAATLDLKQEVVNGGDLPRGDEVFFIDGRVYSYAEAN